MLTLSSGALSVSGSVRLAREAFPMNRSIIYVGVAHIWDHSLTVTTKRARQLRDTQDFAFYGSSASGSI